MGIRDVINRIAERVQGSRIGRKIRGTETTTTITEIPRGPTKDIQVTDYAGGGSKTTTKEDGVVVSTVYSVPRGGGPSKRWEETSTRYVPRTLPAGYEASLEARRLSLQQAQAGIAAQRLRPTAQQLRSSAGGVAERLQRKQAAQQFERAKQESITKLSPEFAEQVRLEKEAADYLALPPEAVTTTTQFHQPATKPVFDTYTLPKGETLVMDKTTGDFRDAKVTGVESQFFSGSFSTEEYGKKIEDYNEKLREQEIKTAKFMGSIGFAGTSTGDGVTWTPSPKIEILPNVFIDRPKLPPPKVSIPTKIISTIGLVASGVAARTADIRIPTFSIVGAAGGIRLGDIVKDPQLRKAVKKPWVYATTIVPGKGGTNIFGVNIPGVVSERDEETGAIKRMRFITSSEFKDYLKEKIPLTNRFFKSEIDTIKKGGPGAAGVISKKDITYADVAYWVRRTPDIPLPLLNTKPFGFGFIPPKETPKINIGFGARVAGELMEPSLLGTAIDIGGGGLFLRTRKSVKIGTAIAIGGLGAYGSIKAETPERKTAAGVIAAGGFLGAGFELFPFAKGLFARKTTVDILGQQVVDIPPPSKLKPDVDLTVSGIRGDLEIPASGLDIPGTAPDVRVEIIPWGGSTTFEPSIVRPDIDVPSAVNVFGGDIPLKTDPTIPRVETDYQRFLLKELKPDELVSGSIMQESLVRGSRSSFGSDIDVLSPDISATSSRLQTRTAQAGYKDITFEPLKITDAPGEDFTIMRIKEKGKVVADIDPLLLGEEGYAARYNPLQVEGVSFVDPKARLAGKLTQLKRGKVGGLLDAEGKVLTDIRQLTGGAIEPQELTGAFGKTQKFQASFLDKDINIGTSAVGFKFDEGGTLVVKDFYGTPSTLEKVRLRESRLNVGESLWEKPRGDIRIGFGSGEKSQALLFFDQRIETKGYGDEIKRLATIIDKGGPGKEGAIKRLNVIMKDIATTTEGSWVPSLQARGELETYVPKGKGIIVREERLKDIRVSGQAVQTISAGVKKPGDVLSGTELTTFQKGFDKLGAGEQEELLSTLVSKTGLSRETILREQFSRDIPRVTYVSPQAAGSAFLSGSLLSRDVTASNLRVVPPTIRRTTDITRGTPDILRRGTTTTTRGTPDILRRGTTTTTRGTPEIARLLTPPRRPPTPPRQPTLLPPRLPPTPPRRPPETPRRPPETPPRRPTIIRRETFDKVEDRLKRLIGKPAYEVQVRRGGKFKTISKALPKGMAMKLGAERVTKTLAATFRLKPKGTTRLSDIGYELSKTQFRLPRASAEKLTFIEKKTKRLKKGTTEIPEILEIRGSGFKKVKGRKRKWL